MAGLTSEDRAQIDAYRATATPEETARFAAELYKLRNTPASGLLGRVPPWLVILIGVWVALIETAEKLPQLALSFPRYEAALAEIQAKLMQPELVKAQLDQAVNEAKASELKPATTQAQLDRALSEVITARYTAEAAPNQPALVAAQLAKATSDAITAKYTAEAAPLAPQTATVTLAKTTLEAQAAVYAPRLREVELAKLGIDAKTAVYQQTATAAQSIQVAQQTAMSQAAMVAMLPMVANILKEFNVNLPMDKLAPMLGIIDPVARTRDLQSALPGGGRAPDATLPTQAPAKQNPQPAPAKVVAPVKVACLLPDGSTSTMTHDQCRAKAGHPG